MHVTDDSSALCGLARVIGNFASVRHLLDPGERLWIAERLRDAADQIDHDAVIDRGGVECLLAHAPRDGVGRDHGPADAFSFSEITEVASPPEADAMAMVAVHVRQRRTARPRRAARRS